MKGRSVDRVIDSLEAGYLDFLMGDFKSASDAFVYAEQQTWNMEDRAMVSATNLSRNFLSNITNLAELEYHAKCEDQIMMHILKALSYLGMGMPEAYNTEIFPLHQTMQDIEQRYMALFQKESDAVNQSISRGRASQVNNVIQHTPDLNSLAPNTTVRNFLNPLALLMAGVARAEAQDWENAKVDFNKLYMAMPNSIIAGQFKREVLRRENTKIPPRMAALPELEFNPNGGNVMVLFANGRGAALVEHKINHPLLHAAIPVPKTYMECTVPTLAIIGDGKLRHTELISDMDGIAVWQYRLGYKEMLTRTIIATLIKEGGSIAATSATYNIARNDSQGRGTAEFFAAIVYFLTDIYKQAQNIADTRSWETLPAQFQAAIVKMPKDRRIQLSVDNMNWAEAIIPQSAKSAIIYVHSVNNGQLRHIVFSK
ncbi:MAG: hypothetical protein IJS15_04825 [Victivallales bacterium]|nr:hypothetical protein [Victivallales bacterium]